MAKESKKENPPIILRKEMANFFNDLSDEEAGILLKASFQYRWEGLTPNLPNGLNYAFKMLKSILDTDAEKYIEKCELNRQNVLKRYQNKE